MYLKKYNTNELSIHDLCSQALALQPSLSEQDILDLIKYQEYICMQLQWIELDSTRLNHILDHLFINQVLHHDSRMKYLRKAIKTYYYLRRLFDSTYDDDSICAMITYIFNIHPHLSFHEALETMKDEIVMDGGTLRNEQSFNNY